MSFVTWVEVIRGAQRSPRQAAVLHQLDALARQVPVLTQNTREFARIGGLRCEDRAA